MSVRSIRFTTDEVRAVLDGRKTTKRLVMKPQPIATGNHTEWNGYEADLFKGTQSGFDALLLARIIADGKSPYRSDDILYVQEAWAKAPFRGYVYEASVNHPEVWSWNPSVNMPREVARIFLRVTDVRVERLRDITLGDAAKEGCENLLRFDELWDDTIKPTDRERYGWAANPWVWVVKFERSQKPEE